MTAATKNPSSTPNPLVTSLTPAQVAAVRARVTELLVEQTNAALGALPGYTPITPDEVSGDSQAADELRAKRAVQEASRWYQGPKVGAVVEFLRMLLKGLMRLVGALPRLAVTSAVSAGRSLKNAVFPGPLMTPGKEGDGKEKSEGKADKEDPQKKRKEPEATPAKMVDTGADAGGQEGAVAADDPQVAAAVDYLFQMTSAPAKMTPEVAAGTVEPGEAAELAQAEALYRKILLAYLAVEKELEAVNANIQLAREGLASTGEEVDLATIMELEPTKGFFVKRDSLGAEMRAVAAELVELVERAESSPFTAKAQAAIAASPDFDFKAAYDRCKCLLNGDQDSYAPELAGSSPPVEVVQVQAREASARVPRRGFGPVDAPQVHVRNLLVPVGASEPIAAAPAPKPAVAGVNSTPSQFAALLEKGRRDVAEDGDFPPSLDEDSEDSETPLQRRSMRGG